MSNAKFFYLLHLADNALILGQRNSEWCGHGPVLEQDIAITNISLDLIGQARNLYQYAARFSDNPEETEDTLAYLRSERAYRNGLLVEQPNGDWAQTILRQFFFSNFQFLQYAGLEKSQDPQIAAIAEKSLKEVTYHLRWSSEWVIRLAQGTEESHQRMNKALDHLWSYTGECFRAAEFEKEAAMDGWGLDPASLEPAWFAKTSEIFQLAALSLPPAGFMHSGGKTGKHTEQMGYILSELQYMQRTYPGANW